MTQQRKPRRPYLLRAMYEWITDNGETPHVVVDATAEGVNVPQSYVRDGKIVLNISPAATQRLAIGNEIVEFEARFGGQPFAVRVPAGSVLGIYARETGAGMIFTDNDGEPPEDGDDDGAPPPKGRPHLKVVK